MIAYLSSNTGPSPALVAVIAVAIFAALMTVTVKLARRKNRGVGNWIVLTLFFGLLATVILLCLPTRKVA